MFWNWPTLQSMCDRFRKQEYDWVSLGIPSTLQKGTNGWHITVLFGDDVLALKTKSNNLHQLETWYTGLQSISIYCCTCQSLNHNKSRSRIYFRTFLKMMIFALTEVCFQPFTINPYLTRYHPYDTDWNGIIGKTRSPGVVLDSPDNIYLGDKFDKLVMTYHTNKVNVWRIFTRWIFYFPVNFKLSGLNHRKRIGTQEDIQLLHVFMLYKGKIWSSVCMQWTTPICHKCQLPIIAGCCCKVISRVTNWFHRRLFTV